MRTSHEKEHGTVYFDEAGYTGTNLLDKDQPYFVYASVAVDDPLAAERKINSVKKRYRLQGRELKGAQLVKHRRGRDAVEEILVEYQHCTWLAIHDKEYALACKFFEYMIEPLFSCCNSVFYAAGFHRFVAKLLYLQLKARETDVEHVFSRFDQLIRSGDVAALRELVVPPGNRARLLPQMNLLLSLVEIEEARIRQELQVVAGEHGTPAWALDLSMGAVFNLLQLWGTRYSTLRAVCDRSRPLKVHEEVFNAMVGRTKRAEQSLLGRKRPLTFNLSEPIILADSHTNPGVQIADVIASAIAHALKAPSEQYRADWLAMFEASLSETSIVPDLSSFEAVHPEIKLGSLILLELADRAERGLDLCQGMAEYVAACSFGVGVDS